MKFSKKKAISEITIPNNINMVLSLLGLSHDLHKNSSTIGAINTALSKVIYNGSLTTAFANKWSLSSKPIKFKKGVEIISDKNIKGNENNHNLNISWNGFLKLLEATKVGLLE